MLTPALESDAGIGAVAPAEMAEAVAAALSVKVGRGNLYLSRELCDAYLAGIDAVALLERDRRVLIVPLIRESGGGLLLKVRNRHGDRVIHAQEFFRENGYLEDFQERVLPVQWDAGAAALAITELPRFRE